MSDSTVKGDESVVRVAQSESIELLGVRINCETYQSLAATVLSWVEQGQKSYCCFTNPHSIIMCQSDEEFKAATNNADLVLPDGVGVVYASKILRLPLTERVTGPTSMLKVIESGLDKELRHYFYGSSEETLNSLQHNLREKFPSVQIAGAHSPPYRELEPAEIDERINAINDSGANVLWIGLGAPRQEKWVQEHFGRVNAPVAMAVGAAFDYHAGTVDWAPNFVRKMGLEWAYRLVQQPKRLFRRNLNSFVFLWKVLKSKRKKN